MQEVINGILVEIIRKNIKTLRITVTNKGIVKVSAPFLLNADIITKFVTTKSDWIVSRQKRFIELSKHQNKIEDGEAVTLWGRRYPLHIKLGQKLNCEFIEEKFVFTQKDISSDQKLALALDRFYKHQLQNKIAERLPLFEELTGLRCSGWSIRKTISRWGSCNIKTKKLCFSLNLAKHPLQCLDYVILHELLHIAIPNHGTSFKAALSRYCPDWKSIRKQLNG